MSHLVTNTHEIQSSPIFNIPIREVIAPHYKNMLRGTISTQHSIHKQKTKEHKSLFKNEQLASKQNSQHRRNTREMWREEMVLISFCNKLTEKQLDQIRLENEVQIKKEFSKLKHKMRRSVVNPHNSVLRYIEGKGEEERLDTLLAKNRNYHIDLGKKHHTKISNRIFCLREAQQIEKIKTKYRGWLDSTNNEPVKSPNFRKMNYVFEKLAERGEENKQLLRKSRNTDKGAQNKGDDIFYQSFMRKNQHSEYSPKSKIQLFRTKKLR